MSLCCLRLYARPVIVSRTLMGTTSMLGSMSSSPSTVGRAMLRRPADSSATLKSASLPASTTISSALAYILAGKSLTALLINLPYLWSSRCSGIILLITWQGLVMACLLHAADILQRVQIYVQHTYILGVFVKQFLWRAYDCKQH